jgi:tRNA (mo5U34)-methyltransferase
MASRQDALNQRIAELGPWYQNIEVASGVWTNPVANDYPASRLRTLQPWIPADLSGKSVLEIGCNAGFFLLEMKKRGAARCVGIDIMPHALAQARFVAEQAGYSLELHQMSAYDIGRLGHFDIVVCLGVLYHLRHPLYALEKIAEVCRETLYFQSVVRGSTGDFEPKADYDIRESAIFDEPAYPKLFFIERSFNADVSNWWFATRSCLTAMLRVAGFPTIQPTGDPEIFICRK